MDKSAVAHAWANQTKESAKGSNFSFNGTTLYSYSTPIAKIIEKNGKKYTLFTWRKYSQTTATQIGIAKSANWHPEIICDIIPDRFDDTRAHSTNVKSYILSIKACIEMLPKVRKKTKYIEEAKQIQEHWRQYLEIFPVKLKKRESIFLSDTIFDTYAEAVKYEQKTISQERAATERKKLAAKGKAIADFKAGKIHRIPHYAGIDEAYLRLNANKTKIETSLEFSVPVGDARTLYEWAKKKIAAGGCTDCDKKFLNHYQIREVSATQIVIGCHAVPTEEYEAIADLLNWNQTPTTQLSIN